VRSRRTIPLCDAGEAFNLRGMLDAATIVTTLIFLLAGFVKGVIGLGLPAVAVGLLGLVMTPAQAAALLIVPSLATNLWQLAAGPQFLRLARRLWPMMLGICVGSWAGAGLLVGDTTGRATIALGIALALYAAFGLATLHLPPPGRAERWLSPVIGAATGLVTAATGVFTLPAVPYLQALQFEKDDLVQALGLSFTVSTLALAADLARGGALASAAGPSLLALLPASAGMLAGQWLRARVAPERFRFWFFLGLLALGCHLALRRLW
jgi:uncharacterized protein